MIKTTSNGERNMSTVKHSKYKNTGILFELLVRQVASDTLSSENSEAVKLYLKNDLILKIKLIDF